MTGSDIWVGLTEQIGYDAKKRTPEVRLALREDDTTKVYYLDLETAKKLTHRLTAYVEAGETV